MSRILYRTASLIFVGIQFAAAQISPGPLSKAHSNLEGISNCTQCHESGEQISGAKCLACHVEIKNQINFRHGFHFAQSSSSCVTCHKEHLGNDAKITRFDESQFDHKATGFLLTGKHGSIKCEQCHAAKNIRNADVRKVLADNPHKTFLGLDRQCASCHQDRHRGSVGTQCQTCHGTTSWSPPETFNHGNTKFALVGKHKAVQCAQCHATVAVKTKTEPILFSTKSFEDCTPCHRSPHGKKFSDKTCRSCHTAEGWSIVVSFDHSSTRFPLVGKHLTVACEKCHTEMGSAKKGTVSFVTKKFDDCAPCHSTPHTPKFLGLQCKSCHTPTAWGIRFEEQFDHSLTKFVLRGKHADLKCEQCHKAGEGLNFSQRFHLPHDRCTDCHEDFHKGQFTAKYSNDCALCHIEQSYKPSTFSITRHVKSSFPLTGAHGAIPCDQCHKKVGWKEPVFRFASIRCETCHEDFHKGQFKKEMVEHSCAQCHSTNDWKMALFDHAKTGFPLIGKHASTKCSDCHKERDVNGLKSVQYKGVPTQCQACHEEIHAGQFAQHGVTDCSPCHSAAGWHALFFNHETQSSFHLTGAHKNVICGGCHKEEKSGLRTFVRYKPLASRCESCHQGLK